MIKVWHYHPHLVSERHVSTGTRPPRIPRILIPIDDNLGYLSILAEVLWLPQCLLRGYVRGHAHGVHKVPSYYAHGGESGTILGGLRQTLAALMTQG